MMIVSQDKTIVVNHNNVKGFWIEKDYLDDDDIEVYKIYTNLEVFQDGMFKPACLSIHITEGDAIKALSELVNAIVSADITRQKAFYFDD